MALKGMATVMRNLTKEVAKVQGAERVALGQAALLVKRESMNKTPVDTGNLRASHETEVMNEGSGPKAEIRVGAEYALYVHEMPENYNFKRPGSGPKFLEKALYENQDQVLQILATVGRVIK